jgi:uncharacterized membrane protein YfcA
MNSTFQPHTTSLFPVYLKLDQLHVLLVGGGESAAKQLSTLLSYAPNLSISIVGETIFDEIKSYEKYPQITIHQRKFLPEDVEQKDMVVIAVSDNLTASYIRLIAKVQNLWVHVVDNPSLSDFQLGTPLQDEYLSTRTTPQTSTPTKVFNTPIKKFPQLYRSSKSTVNDTDNSILDVNWRKVITYSALAFALMLIGHFIFSYIPLQAIADGTVKWYGTLDKNIHWMIIAGFVAQLVDGALGMGYGVTSTTILLSTGTNPAAISGSIHTAEIFASGASGYSHYRFGNVNKKLFKALLIPGVVGAILGAVLLVQLGDSHLSYIRPILAAYTLFLGIRILLTAFRKPTQQKKFKRHGWLAGIGGFLDSFGGGGWGPIVTTTLITKGRSPRYVIGSVSITEFFVTLASAFTFFTFLGVTHWQVIVALIIGGLAAAPIAARLTGKLPKKTSFILLGTLVIFWSLKILITIF